MKVHLCWYKNDIKLETFDLNTKIFSIPRIFQTILCLSSARASLSQVVTFGALRSTSLSSGQVHQRSQPETDSLSLMTDEGSSENSEVWKIFLC